MKRIVVLAFVLIMLIPTMAEAQKKWSLLECIEYALEHNIMLQQQALSVDVSTANHLQSKAAMLPSLNASGTHVYNYGRTIDLYTNDFATERVQSNNFYLSSNIAVFNGFQLLNTVRKSKIDLQAAQMDLEQLRDDIRLSVATAYLNILFNKELLEVAKNQAEITRLQVKRTKQLVDAGTLAKGNLLTMEAQLASEEMHIVNAENALDMSLLTLAQFMDMQFTPDFDIETPLITMPDARFLNMSPQGIYEYALQSRPGVMSASLKVESAEKSLSIAKSGISPRLSLSASIGTGYSGASQEFSGFNLTGGLDTIGYTYESSPLPVVIPGYTTSYSKVPFNKQINDNLNQSIGLYLNIPIFNGLQTHTAITQSKIGVENARLVLESSKNQLRKEIEQAHADAEAAFKRYKAAEKSLNAMKESFEYTEQKYEVGMLNSVDYNDAKNKLLSAESDVLQAKYEFFFRIKILDFYQGKPLDLK